ncbi:MAG TPA: hypothetical protein PLR74_05330 [Agriterribacter sp.]|nr:hypothetical protein [Agriterribacter sp.]
MNHSFPITEEELDLIDRYLNDHLPVAERAAFEQRLADQQDWRQKVEEIRLISLGIREWMLEQRLEAFEENVPAAIVPVKKTDWKKWLVAASVIVLVVAGAWLLFREPENEKLFAAYYKPDPGLPVGMGGNSSNYIFYDGMVDYKEGNYTVAIEKWKSVGDRYAYTDTLNYYLGLACMGAGNMEQAVQYLGKVFEKDSSPYTQKAIWYQALAYIKLGNNAAAGALLRQTAGMPEAKTLLNRISD